MVDFLARIADDSDPLRFELETARAWGVPHSVFLGAPKVTTYRYDQAGKIVQTKTVGWTAEDREKAVALAAYEAQVCGGCGGYLPETTLHASVAKYETELVAQCHKCVARQIRADAESEKPHSFAFIYRTVRRLLGGD